MLFGKKKKNPKVSCKGIAVWGYLKAFQRIWLTKAAGLRSAEGAAETSSWGAPCRLCSEASVEACVSTTGSCRLLGSPGLGKNIALKEGAKVLKDSPGSL